MSFNAQKEGNVCLGILNGTEMRNLDTNVLGGNETTYYFAAFCLCLSALFSISMA